MSPSKSSIRPRQETLTTWARRLAIGDRYIMAAEVIGPGDVVEASWPVLLPLLEKAERETR